MITMRDRRTTINERFINRVSTNTPRPTGEIHRGPVSRESTYEQGRRIYPTGGEIKSLYPLSESPGSGFIVRVSRLHSDFASLAGNDDGSARAKQRDASQLPDISLFSTSPALYFPNFVRYRVPPAKLHHPLPSPPAREPHFFALSQPVYPNREERKGNR